MRTATVKLTNVNKPISDMKRIISEALKTPVNTIARGDLNHQLGTNKQADGTPRPASSPVGKKYPATIKQYERHGWDTEHYLIRTGASTKLKSKMRDRGMTLEITPANTEILGYHIPENKWRGKMDWMSLTESASGKIIDVVRKRLRRRFH